MSAPIQYIPSILIDAVIEALGAFIAPFVAGGTPITRAQVNRVAPPNSPFVELREILQTDLETPTSTNSTEFEQAQITTPTRIDVQVDFYGPAAGDWCKAIKAVMRSQYAPAQFPDGIAPLYCSDGNQAPLVTGEEQYENRWIITCSLQYNPDVFVPQQSATALAMNETEDIP
jgi:hypothetical protein